MSKQQGRQADSAEGHRPVRVIVRAVRLLDALSSNEAGVGISEIARRSQMSKSTVHNILQTLVATRLAVIDPETHLYQLGPKPIDWARAYSASVDIGAMSRPYLRRLRQETGETVAVFVRAGTQRVCAARVESEHVVRHVADIGEIHPLWQSAPGRVLMSGMADEDIVAFLRDADLSASTPYTMTDPKEILAAIHEIRRTGFSLAEQEVFMSTAAFAVPIRDGTGGVVGALTVSGPFERWNHDTVTVHLPRIMATAEELSGRLGFHRDSA